MKKQLAAASPAPAKIVGPTLIGRSQIREIQTLLSKMNFKPEDADGQLGQRTADPIKLYQKFAGLDVDGRASRDLLEDLRAVAETMAKGG
jgi:peptidoglycan hydrolase-like protein with peptidoglycan-binding domain